MFMNNLTFYCKIILIKDNKNISDSQRYLDFSNDPSHSSNVNPREYDKLKQQQYTIDPVIEMNNLRSQTEFYRHKTIQLKNNLEMILQDKRK